MDKLAGCLPSSNASDPLQGLVVLCVPDSADLKVAYAVHALKGSSVFYFNKRGDLDCCGTGCPKWSSV